MVMFKNDVVEKSLPVDLMLGRVAIITGGSRGVGRATALRLAQAGASVVINYTNREAEAEEVVCACRKHGVKAVAKRADVSNVEDAVALAKFTVENFGRIDLLVANAGIWEGAPVELMTECQWNKVLDTNLKGTWAACRAVIPEMKSRSRGAIVIVSSTAAQRGEAGYSSYAASKGGQISFAKSLAVELAPNIRVNSVAPGWIETEMNEPVFKNNGGYKENVVSSIPLKRFATADDVALSIIFLASDWSRHITGEVLNINGGAVLCG